MTLNNDIPDDSSSASSTPPAIIAKNERSGEKSTNTFTPQRPPRPLRYRPNPLRSRMVLLSLGMVLILTAIVGMTMTVFGHPSPTHTPSLANTKNTLTTIPTRPPTPTLTPTAMPTPTPISTPTPAATSKPLPTPTPTMPTTASGILAWATSGQPFINDQLQSQNNNNWSENTTSRGSCGFSGGSYHVSALRANLYTTCLALGNQDSNLQNIAFQVQVTITQGDAGGLLFHANASGSNNYAFTFCIDSACGQGEYGLYIAEGQHYNHIISGPNAAIKTNLNQTNLLTVVALNGNIYLYVNDQNVALINDNTFSSGYIGLTAYEGSNSTNVSFSNAQVWKL